MSVIDVMANSPICFTSKYKAIGKENLVVNQTSLGDFFHAPLQFASWCEKDQCLQF